MKTTFNKLVGESRESLEIIDSHTLKTMIENKEDMAIFENIISKSDILIQNLAPGAFERLGLDLKELSCYYLR